MEEGFGLVEQEYDTDKSLADYGRNSTQWQRFAHKLQIMNQIAPRGVTYRLLYLGRHGQGYHNVGIMFYGDAAWDVRLVFSLPSQFLDSNLSMPRRNPLAHVPVTDVGFTLI